MNILILAYACEPESSSEYDVGWMVPTVMSKRHPEGEVYVVTRSRCREKIEDALRDGYPNLHFLFYDIPSWMFYKNEMKSHWGEQINCLLWQLMVRKSVRRWCKELKIDVVHHLTFNQYRTPSPGFWVDVPFMMGPIGGAEVIAPAFWQDLDRHTRIKERIRQKGRDLKLFGWFMRRRNNKKLVLCSCEENLQRLKPYVGDTEIKVLPAIAYNPETFASVQKDSSRDESSFEMVYAGKAWNWKGLHILLKAMKKMIGGVEENEVIRLKLIGIRYAEEQKQVMQWVEELGLEDQVELIPFMRRADLLSKVASSDLCVYPAFRDSGSMAVLEACALGCPTVCFDAGGQSVFPDDILLKVPVAGTYDECLSAFADKLAWAYSHRDELTAVGLRAQKWVSENMTWDRKVDELYNESLALRNGL